MNSKMKSNEYQILKSHIMAVYIFHVVELIIIVLLCIAYGIK